jgi:DNA-binding MarR family transcriptional regulator
MDDKLIDQLDTALHDIFRAMNLDRLPVHREGDCFSSKNMSLMETRILRNIDEHEQVSLKDVRAAVDIPNSSLTSIIKKFEQKGLIVRLIDPNDRRSFLLCITEEGHLVNEGIVTLTFRLPGFLLSG